jgi:hypothetical protein
MDRRTAIQNAAILIGASFISVELVLTTGCKPNDGKPSLSGASGLDFNASRSTLAAIGATIIPAFEKHPGFVGVKGENMLVTLLNDCYKKEDQDKIVAGLERFETDVKTKYSKEFALLDPAIQNKIISEIDQQYFDDKLDKDKKPTYYGMIKEAVLISYFTDAAVMKNVQSHVKIPRKYDGAFKVEPETYSTRFGFG